MNCMQHRTAVSILSAAITLPLTAASTTPAHAQGVFAEDVNVICTMTQPGSGFFGWSTDAIEDINGDGRTDYIIPAPFIEKVFVYAGGACRVIHTLTPPSSGGFFGNDANDAGDVNGDGTHDIIVGASQEGVFGAGPGNAYLFSGDDGSLIRTLVGEANGDQFGFDVSVAGDVNQDGFSDVIIGAPLNDTQGVDSGRAYIYSGTDGSLIRTLEAEAAGDLFGAGTASLGDLNDDGIPDQVVSAISGGPNGAGKAYAFSGADGALLFAMSADNDGVVFGRRFIDPAGDVDGDGLTDIYVADWNAANGAGKAYVFSGAGGAVIHRWPGTARTEGVGPGRGAGDVDGDGHADLGVGHWTSVDGGINAGKTVIFSGRTGEPLRTLTSLTPNENFGFNVTGVGDANGDGINDILVSAASANRVYLISGGSSCTPAAPPEPELEPVGKSRYLTVAPTNAGEPTALRVTLVDVDGFADVNGETRWIGRPDTFPEEDSSDPGRMFTGAALSCEPHFADWSSVGLLHLFGAEIVPGSEYEVQVVSESCGAAAAESAFSEPLTVLTGKFGDAVPPFAFDGGSVQPDFNDIASLVNKFLGNPDAPIKACAQLVPNHVTPDNPINFNDIAAGVQGFLDTPFAFLLGVTGPCTCPSSVACGVIPCANNNDCGGGVCLDGFCTDPCGRCAEP